MYISIIIPCYNEARRVEKNLISKIAYLKSQNYSWEIILVDDGSKDNTVKFINQIIADNHNPNIRLVTYPKNQGKGYAVKRGMLSAKGQYCLFTDLDNSTSMEELPGLLKYSKEFEVVIASRYIKGSRIVKKQSFSRRLVSRMGNIFIRYIIGLNLRDTQCGFKLFSSVSANKIFTHLESRRWGFDIECLLLAQKLGYRIKEIPVRWEDVGDSKLQTFKASMMVFSEAVKSKYNIMTNKYKIR